MNNYPNFNGEVALVTGASSGMGLATAQAFAEAGASVVSLLLVPGFDGRREVVPTVFDGVNPSRTSAVALKLQSVEPRAKDALWVRYQAVRS